MPAHDAPQFGSPLLKRRAAAKSAKGRRKPSSEEKSNKADSEASETESQMSKSEMGTRYNHQWHRNGNFVKFRYPQRFHDQFKEPERQSLDHKHRLPFCLRRNLRYGMQPVRLMCQYTPTKSLTFVKAHNIKSNKLPHPLHRSFKKDAAQEEESFGGNNSARSGDTITLHAREQEENEDDREHNGSYHYVYEDDRVEQADESHHTTPRSQTQQDEENKGAYSDDQFENENDNENEDRDSIHSDRDDDAGSKHDDDIRSVHSEQQDEEIKSDAGSDTDLPIQEAHEADKTNGNANSDSSSVHSDMETMNWNSQSPRAQARPMTAMGSRGNSGRARITTSVSLKQKRAEDK